MVLTGCFDRLVGFDDLGNTDDFNTSTLELQLSNAGKRIQKTNPESTSRSLFPFLSAGVIRKKEEKAATQKKSIFQTVDSDGDDDDDYWFDMVFNRNNSNGWYIPPPLVL